MEIGKNSLNHLKNRISTKSYDAEFFEARKDAKFLAGSGYLWRLNITFISLLLAICFLIFKLELFAYLSGQLSNWQQMVRMLRICMQSLLKFVNSGNGMVGIAMILYGIWLIRAWQRHFGHLPYGPSDPIPWFMYSFFGLGILLCVITCLGHIAAETANGCCLHLYMVLVFMVLMVEAGVTTDVFLNRDWEEDFPKDPSGSFDQFKHFIKLNFDICKWIGISMVSIQGLSLLLAMVLKAIGSRRYYDSDDEYASERLPLLKNALHSPTTCVIGDPVFPSKNDTWNKRTDGE